jgi:DNA-binding response OmpR family regulator
MKILIIEDDKTLTAALKKSLEDAGYAVTAFSDGTEGEHHFVINYMDYDLLILDLMLPGKDGFLICKDIRKLEINTPVLILTGKTETSDKVSALDSGADDYLTKPFSAEELLARVRALLRRPKEVLPESVSVKDIEVDLTSRKVFKGGKEIPLTLKEFGILEYLVRYPNQIISRDRILDHVWDFNFSSFSNVVDVHITNLRKKLRGDGEEEYIETVRGVGYRLKA